MDLPQLPCSGSCPRKSLDRKAAFKADGKESISGYARAKHESCGRAIKSGQGQLVYFLEQEHKINSTRILLSFWIEA
jgi:hypothetical protein